MSNVSSEVVTHQRYRWTIPCDYPMGGDYKELMLALHWAEREAKDHGIDTTTDNWLHILPEDDRVAVYFDVVQKS